MADNYSSGLTVFENYTLKSALMADNILDINMNIEALGPVGGYPQKLVLNTDSPLKICVIFKFNVKKSCIAQP